MEQTFFPALLGLAQRTLAARQSAPGRAWTVLYSLNSQKQRLIHTDARGSSLKRLNLIISKHSCGYQVHPQAPTFQTNLQCLCQSAQDVITKCHTLSSLNNRLFKAYFPHTSGSQNSLIKVQENSVSGAGSLPGFQTATTLLWAHMAFPQHMCMETEGK